MAKKPAQVEPKQEVSVPEVVPEGDDLATSINNLAAIVDPTTPAKPEVRLQPEVVEEEKQEKQNDSSSGMTWTVVAFCAGLACGIIAGYGLWGRATTETHKQIAQVEPTAAPTVLPTAAATMNRADLKIKVLNGTDKTGVASTGAKFLEGLGYKDVGTGNSAKNYDTTQVILAADKTAFWPQLKTDLAAKYQVGETYTTDATVLTVAGGVDAVVIVGTK